MWPFDRKPKNRRFNRGHVLDVKLRSDQVRASRLRWCVLGSALLFGTALGIYGLWRAGQWSLNRLVYENRAFAIAKIDAQTDGVIAPDQLRRWANVKLGDNLFALDLARVKRDLEMVPLVSFVSVERLLPRTLRIRVNEREPVVQVNVPLERARRRRDPGVSSGPGWVRDDAARSAPARDARQPAGGSAAGAHGLGCSSCNLAAASNCRKCRRRCASSLSSRARRWRVWWI